MNILWHIHAYPPVHNAGAEWMAHEMNRYLRNNHQIRVLSSWNGEFEGIPVISDDNPVLMNNQYIWADVIISHLGRSGIAFNKSRQHKKPMIFVSHNTHPYHFCRIDVYRNVYVVHNAEWSMRALMYQRPGIVVYPPVNHAKWKRSKGKMIGLINLNENKGGQILEQIARLMPDKKFLAVRGMYGKQHEVYPDNVEVVDNTPDMQGIYSRCGIILMPSDYESWGRVAVEAMSCGIPVIANPTPGLKESLGSSGIFVRRSDLDGWVNAIRNLDAGDAYISASKKALERAKALDPEPQMQRMEQFLNDIINKKI
jgi:glycosyltransferase involved in cell wall biosynthesis